MPLRVSAVIAVACLSLAGCGGSHKTASGSTTPTTAAAAAGAASTPTTVDTSNPAAVESSVDSSLNDLNQDLSSIDTAPTDEGDPTQ